MSELECLAYGIGQAGQGVCLLLRLGDYRIMLDCGLTDLSPLTSNARPPADLVLCSHAHADHASGLLDLHRQFQNLPIYASEVTTQLLPLNWAEQSLPLSCRALPWRTPIEFFDGLTAALYPAGHLPGAAAILLSYKSPSGRHYSVLYTGDFFLSNSRLVEGLPLEELRGLSPDVLIVEGSYGTARHPHRRQQENQLAERISQAIASEYCVLLPTAPLGLAQELLMLLRSHHHFTGKDFTIWVDQAVATACDAYLEILADLPSSVQNFARHQPLFWDEKVRPRVRRWSSQADHAPALVAPCIVLCDEVADLSIYYGANPAAWLILQPQEPHRAESQVWERDRAVRSAPSEAPTDRSQPALANQAAAASLPKALSRSQAGALPPTEVYLLAQHCDGPGTTQLIHNLRPQHVIFVHGSSAYLADLTGLEELQNRYQLHSPAAGSVVELPIGEVFVQPALPETSYAGELTEVDPRVTIMLPNTVTADPRWRILADTGLIEARWQGDELVLRGVPQQEFLRQGSDRRLDWLTAAATTRNCCANCLYFRGQQCWNPNSPLYELKVTLDGFCPAFEGVAGNL